MGGGWAVGAGGGSQQLLCLNPTTVMVVLLLGCDNERVVIHKQINNHKLLTIQTPLCGSKDFKDISMNQIRD